MSDWIRIDERLPDVKDDRSKGVLVYTSSGAIRISFLWSDAMQMSFSHNAPYEIIDRWHKQESQGYAVTHWMPLPEPPKEQSKW